jgi:hypothetical protein
MRQGAALLLGLIASVMLGCVSSQPAPRGSWLDRLLHPAGPTGPDVVQMDLALIERPVGDAYLNHDLWVSADEQVVALDNKALLEDNGFRIGQIGGITPVGLQTLLTSERSCANPRRIRTQAGRPSKLVLGPELAECRFRIERDGELVPVTLEKAQCTLEVVPSLTADGRTRLRFVPQIFHGETTLLPRPTTDLSGWILKEERPTERYAALAWEVTLAPNEYVLIGGRYDRPETLGQQCFLRADEPTPVQRLLVIRTSRPGKELEGSSPPPGSDDGAVPALPPIASRAAMTTARGSGR